MKSTEKQTKTAKETKTALPKTLGELKVMYPNGLPGVKEELRANLLRCYQNKQNPFPGIIGYEDTVLPQVEQAILAGHDILFLGLRGQAKTRLARQLVALLDPWMPCVAGSPLREDPFKPLLNQTKEQLVDLGDNTPIEWIAAEERYVEKLATPDVMPSDLIGDIDPILAAKQGLSLSDSRAILFGLIPKANRGIFVLNELPDLQARIQVALFNILEESDIQIRGFNLRLALDLQCIFTANPEDYTNRGAIVTPLKDRIGAQILTHYPLKIEDSIAISNQECSLPENQLKLHLPEYLRLALEQISFEARNHELVDAKSGVSARMGIRSLELLYAVAEWRTLKTSGGAAVIRCADLYQIIPAIQGKIELLYEGEQEGPAQVAKILIGKAIRSVFLKYFPDPSKSKKREGNDPFAPVCNWFSEDNELEIQPLITSEDLERKLERIPGMNALIETYVPVIQKDERGVMMEFILYALSEFSLIGRHDGGEATRFADILSGFLGGEDEY
jgi:magnesium chelatase subunit I